MKINIEFKYFIILKRGDIILLEFLEYGDQGDPTLGEVFFLRTNSEGETYPSRVMPHQTSIPFLYVMEF